MKIKIYILLDYKQGLWICVIKRRNLEFKVDFFALMV